MGNVIAISNQKGGVSKTTTSYNLGACLALDHNKKVLLIDADPQANLSEYLRYEPDGKPNITNLIMDICLNRAVTEEDVRGTIRYSKTAGVDYIPSDINLASSEVLMATTLSRETVIKRILVDNITAEYDFIFIDCLPSLGSLLINALTAADKVIIPVQTQKFAMDGLEALEALYYQVKTTINTKLDLIGVLPTLADRTNISKTAIDTLIAKYGDKVFKTSISKSIEAAKSVESGIPLCKIKSRLGSEYKELAKEFLNRV